MPARFNVCQLKIIAYLGRENSIGTTNTHTQNNILINNFNNSAVCNAVALKYIVVGVG